MFSRSLKRKLRKSKKKKKKKEQLQQRNGKYKLKSEEIRLSRKFSSVQSLSRV